MGLGVLFLKNLLQIQLIHESVNHWRGREWFVQNILSTMLVLYTFFSLYHDSYNREKGWLMM